MPTLWIVHRDAGRRAVLARLAGAGEDTILGDPSDRLFEGSPPADAVLLGLSGDFEAELEFAHRFAPRLESARWILVTEAGDAADAKRLFDTLDAEILGYPPMPDALRARLRAAARRRPSEPLSERRSRDVLAARFARWFGGVELPEVLRALDPRLARTPVLILGEPGTGRSLLAHYLHAFGGTTGGALVRVRCHPALGSEALLGAIGQEARSERARRSLCVVLEDVDRLEPSVQREIRSWIELTALPVLAHSSFVRWIATAGDATGDEALHLEPSLRHALSALPIRLPALRESRGRIEGLVADGAEAFSAATGSRRRSFSPEALETLGGHPWPDNLRELEAVVQRTLAGTSEDPVGVSSLRFDPEPLRRAGWEEPAGLGGASYAPAEPLAAVAPAPPSPEEETWALVRDEAPAGPEQFAPIAAPTPERKPPADLVTDHELRRFLGAISHEIGNAAVPLRTAAALYAERLQDPDVKERFARLVETDARRLDDVLARLARFASFDAPKRAPVDLAALVESLVAERRTDLETRELLLLSELERAAPPALGDEEQLRFGLDALLRKATQIARPRGDLFLASRHHAHGLRGSPSVRVLLRFHGGAAPKASGVPNGLSLSESALDVLLAEAIVRAHGGRLTVDAADGGETVVLVDLPAAPRA